MLKEEIDYKSNLEPINKILQQFCTQSKKDLKLILDFKEAFITVMYNLLDAANHTDSNGDKFRKYNLDDIEIF